MNLLLNHVGHVFTAACLKALLEGNPFSSNNLVNKKPNSIVMESPACLRAFGLLISEVLRQSLNESQCLRVLHLLIYMRKQHYSLYGLKNWRKRWKVWKMQK